MEHAGATLKTDDGAEEDGENADAAAEMESEQSAETVSKHHREASCVLRVQH